MEFKQIPQFPAYEASACGIIRRASNQKPVKQGLQMIKGKETGYLYCTLVWNEQGAYLWPPKRVAVHRLIAYAWNPNSDPAKVWINHKDGIKSNNTADNLEWTTISQNIQHAFDTGLKVAKKGIESPLYGRKTPLSTKLLMSKAKLGANHPKFKGYYVANFKKFESANQAAIYLNINNKKILRWCHDPRYKAKGYYFIPRETITISDPNSVLSHSVGNPD